MDFITTFLTSDVRTAMPILLAALGLVYSERAGVVNIGVEGIMLIGALASFAGSFFLGNAWAGMAVAMLCGLLIGLVFAFLVVTVKANQTVIGMALNIFGSGLTITLNRIIFGINASPPPVDSYSNVPVPVLSKIPMLGDILFNHNVWVYIAIGILIVAHVVLFKTELGLRIRAVGENPKACDTLGISVSRIRYGTVLYSCAMCGLAGGYMSLAQLNFFIEGMVSGRGFIALAAVVFGKWKPLGILMAVLVFGAGEAIQFKLAAAQNSIPFQFTQMIPYVLTILALIGLVGKSQGPAASGRPYIKE
ncbi:MAG: ABC transporter permease [Bacillota bacterium]